jgi:hypothetical protein
LFGWSEPDDTDLVKDGAAAIRTLGNAIDTSLGDLLGGTTGQVLSKNSNTNMDFTWVTSDDANAIQNAIVDAKGDLIAATAADTPDRLAVGANGTILEAASGETTGLKWGGAWTTFTPTFNANVTVGNGTTLGRYAKVGNTVYCYLEFVLGSTSAITGFIQANLPVTAVSGVYPVAAPLGQVLFRDSGVSFIYGNVIVSGPTLVELAAINVAGTYPAYTSTSSTVPFTWGTSDFFSASFTYQAA